MGERAPTACRGCGQSILWITIAGKRIPLDASAPVYHRVYDSEKGGHFWTIDTRDPEGNRTALVNHFSVCPDRDQFSGKGGK